MSNQLNEKLNVYLTLAMQEVIESARRSRPHKERSALGRVQEINGEMVVTDLFFPKQRNSQAKTDMTNAPADELAEYLVERGSDLGTFDQWRLWLHSHNSMPPFWSGTDEQNRKGQCSEMWWIPRENQGWALSIVIGAGATYHGTVDYKVGNTIMSTDINVVGGLGDFIQGVDFEEVRKTKLSELKSYEEKIKRVPKKIKKALLHNKISSLENKKESYKIRYFEELRRKQSETRERELVENGTIDKFYEENTIDEVVRHYATQLNNNEEKTKIQPSRTYGQEIKTNQYNNYTHYHPNTIRNKDGNSSDEYKTPSDKTMERELYTYGYVFHPKKGKWSDPSIKNGGLMTTKKAYESLYE